jgi:hypothetical protein
MLAYHGQGKQRSIDLTQRQKPGAGKNATVSFSRSHLPVDMGGK